MPMETIRVRAAAGSYPVVSGRGALSRLGALVRELRPSGEVFVLSSPRVWRHWGRTALRALGGQPRERLILFDDREAAKRLGTVEAICRKLIRAQADRGAIVVAVGGGVVGDVAGFVAASYLRGVRLVHVPTTLVAQVDSAIGGKTGVNLPEGKNLVGAFYPPKLVVVDPIVLRTLSLRQFRSGVYEIIKYGVIADARLFEFLERDLEKLLRRNAAALARVAPRCLRAKAAVVGRDERESGRRQILNFGHTAGHALEAAARYRRFLHGEAVGWGLLAATLLSVAADGLAERDAARIARLIARCGPLPEFPRAAPRAILGYIEGDKKSRRGRVRWVLARRIGAADTGIALPDTLVEAALRALPAFFARARSEM